jgi:proline dehydrogenase
MSLMRDVFLKASQSSWLREQAPKYRFVRRTAGRFIPGEHLPDALAAAERLAKNNIASLLTHLGENVADRAEADRVTGHYLEALDQIRSAQLPSEISVKLTQLGLDLRAEICHANLAKLIERSPEDQTVWIDMEHSPYVDSTLALYHRARQDHRNVGVCVQAYLYRTENDLESLLSVGASVRLVKGAYNEPPEIAFPKKADVNENYFRLAQILLSAQSRPAGIRVAFATHDRSLIARISRWAEEQKIARDQFEFEFLYGIQRAEQVRLAQEGYHCRVLVSYGTYWFPWFMRRLAERPANALFLARNILSR